MYVSTWDIAGVMLALAVALTLITTCAVANARLERSRNAWRKAYYDIKDTHQCHCAECD